MYESCNQSYSMHPDFFDPLHQYVVLDMEPGNPEFVKAYYVHEKPSVTVTEDGTVKFYMYAPKAEKVAAMHFCRRKTLYFSREILIRS